MAKKWLDKCKAFLLDILFPNRCPFCNEFIMWDKLICEECENSLVSANDEICRNCGNEKCCCNEEWNYDAVYASFFFDDSNVSNAIYSFKNDGIINIAEYTAKDAAERMSDENQSKPDVIVPVPMGKRKQRKRGHNQAELLGRCIGKCLDISVRNDILFKHDSKTVQHFLSSEKRKENVKGLFYGSSADLNGKTVLLCDDVLTTGATLNECAGIIKSMGAEKVIVVVCAVTSLDNLQEKGA